MASHRSIRAKNCQKQLELPNMGEVIRNIGINGFDVEFKKVDEILNKATIRTLYNGRDTNHGRVEDEPHSKGE